MQKHIQNQIEAYIRKEPILLQLEQTIIQILHAAKYDMFPEAIVQTRVKKLDSFVRKAIKKKNSYSDPINQFPDLCGARVIMQRQQTVEQFCDYIKNVLYVTEFDNVSRRLQTQEFGYLSIHLKVELAADNILGVTVPKEIQGIPIELQVRTQLQNLWADTCHDSIYKSSVTIPNALERESAQLSALLENAEADFTRMIAQIEMLAHNYTQVYTQSQADFEIDLLETLIQNQKNSKDIEKLLIQLLHVLLQTNQCIKAITIFNNLSNTYTDIQQNISVLYVLALIYYKNNDLNLACETCKKALQFAEKKPSYTRASNDVVLLANIYMLYASVCLSSEKADYIQKAYRIQHDNPIIGIAFFEQELLQKKALDGHYNSSALIEIIKQCNHFILHGIKRLECYLILSKVYLYSNNLHNACEYLIYVINEYGNTDLLYDVQFFDDFKKCIESLSFIKQSVTNYEYFEILLFVAHRSIHSKQAFSQVHQESSCVIVSGTCDEIQADLHEKTRIVLHKILKNYRGIIISGGTNAGICGIVAQVANDSPDRAYKTCGYLPQEKQKQHAGYDSYVLSNTADFSICDAIAYWNDILNLGIAPCQVRVLGYGGKVISHFEYMLAIALGAKVALVRDFVSDLESVFADDTWEQHAYVNRYPHDFESLHAFVYDTIAFEFKHDEIEKMAQQIHNAYNALAKPYITSWEQLADKFKNSNRSQARYIPNMLRQMGYSVKPLRNDGTEITTFSEAEMLQLSKLEHGRWVAERLCAGWKYGNVRDDKEMIHPNIVSWDELPLNIQHIDTHAINNFPVALRTVGYGIYKL